MNVIPGPPFPGAYQHFRGGIYIVRQIVVDETNHDNGRIMVLYEKTTTGKLYVRTIHEFNQMVHADDGTPSIMSHLIGGKQEDCALCVPRFHQMTPEEILDHNAFRTGAIPPSMGKKLEKGT